MQREKINYLASGPVSLPFAGLIAAASSARFFIHSSYSGVPRRGGTSLGMPPNHIGMWSETTALTGAQDVSIETALDNRRDRMSQVRRPRRVKVLIYAVDTEIWL